MHLAHLLTIMYQNDTFLTSDVQSNVFRNIFNLCTCTSAVMEDVLQSLLLFISESYFFIRCLFPFH